MKISVVIPTFNSEKMIEVCLDSLRKQTYPPHEVIVVDGQSTDATTTIVKGFDDVTLIMNEKSHTPGSSRNIGILSAESDIICFIDSDCIAEEHWIEETVKCWPKFNSKICGMRGKTFPKINNIFTNILLNGVYISKIHRGNTDNISYRRSALIKVGLFNTELYFNEDGDLARRLKKQGYKIAYNNKAIVFHDYSFSIDRFIQREINFGKGFFMGWEQSRDITQLIPIIFSLISIFSISFSLLVNPSVFFLVLTALTIVISIYYKQYFQYFIKKMNFIYIPFLIIIYICKNICNLIGFFLQIINTIKK